MIRTGVLTGYVQAPWGLPPGIAGLFQESGFQDPWHIVILEEGSEWPKLEYTYVDALCGMGFTIGDHWLADVMPTEERGGFCFECIEWAVGMIDLYRVVNP